MVDWEGNSLTLREWTSNIAARCAEAPGLPLCVLGVGFYRAWTETVYVNSSVQFPSQGPESFACYNIVSIATLVVIALLAKRLSPLCRVKGIFPLTFVLMVASTLMNFGSIVQPAWGPTLAVPAVLCGGVGISLVMMLWSEFYGCINPFRTALYYAASIVLGAVVLWVFKGLLFWWLCVGAALLPLASLLSLSKSLKLLPTDEQPHAAWGKFQFPVKPVALVALYSFAYGLRESVFFSSPLGLHSSFGVLVPSVAIIAGIWFFRERFRLSLIWKMALPLMLLSLLPFDFMLPFGQRFSDFCAVASYTACLILVMVIMGNLSYRYGVCALWLFAIERAVRLVAVLLGLGASSLMSAYLVDGWAEIVLDVVIVLVMVAATLVLLSEKELCSTWGVVLDEVPADQEEMLEKNRLGMKCTELSKQFGLSSREEEVLLLLAQKKRRSTIEHELYIAESTLKTHIRHIYQKLEVHSKEELYDLVGVEKKA